MFQKTKNKHRDTCALDPFLSSILSGTDNIVFITDSNYRILHTSDEAKTRLERTEGEGFDPINKNLIEDVLIEKTAIQKILESVIQYKIPRIDSINYNNKILKLTIDPILNFDRDITHIVFIARDITIETQQQQNIDELKKQEKELIENEQRITLHAKMKSHFLFNSLSTIAKMLKKNPVVATKMIMQLTRSYRFILRQSFEEECRFEDEIEFVRDYIELRKYEFRNDIDVQIHYDDNMRNILIPPWTIQPFIENIYEHSDLDKAPNPFIKINATRSGSKIEIEIINSMTHKHIKEENKRSLGDVVTRLRKHNKGVNVDIKTTDSEFRAVLRFRL